MNAPRHASTDRLLKLYDASLETHGDTAQGAMWPNQEDRLRRFDVMLDLITGTPGESMRLCDLACGTGELLAHIRQRGLSQLDYFGVDASHTAVTLARTKFPGERFMECDVAAADSDLDDLHCDYLVANGLFTLKGELDYRDMWTFMETILSKVWPLVRRGLAFNVMSKDADWERDDLFHVPMDDLIHFLHKLAGRHVVFRSDYGLYEYTAYVYRAEVGAEPGRGRS